MAVLLYQIGIFLSIQIASLFGKSARNTAVILISVFTLLQVFVSWLLILQVITIIISYQFSKNWIATNQNETSPKQPNRVAYSYKNEGGRAYTEVSLNDNDIDSEIRKKAALQERLRKESLAKYERDENLKNSVDRYLAHMTDHSKSPEKTIKPKTEEEVKIYYIARAQVHGPISTNEFLELYKSEKINKNCFTRRESDKTFTKRAHEIAAELGVTNLK